MKTASECYDEIANKYKGTCTTFYLSKEKAIDAMELYADQFKVVDANI